MKKILALVLAMMMVLSLAACGGGTPASQAPSGEPTDTTETSEPTTDPAEDTDEPTTGDNTYEVALVTDVGNIDDKSFNEGTWNGVVEYCEANGTTYNYYRPSEDSAEARAEAIGNAVSRGAKVVVCPGYMFAETLTTVQALYPEVMFLGIDVAEGDMDEVLENTALITYQEEQAGYLAGYAAVMDGFTKLGFLGGMAVPAVIRYGYGFVQGADAAAVELDVDVQINYWYGNTFGPSDDVKVKMDGWFTGGTEVVFACGGGIYMSALQAADQAGAYVIGVDVDQAAEDDIIISSAMKDLAESTVVALTALYENDGVWPADYAGKGTILGAADGAVALPVGDSWRFRTYTVEEYEELFAEMVAGNIEISDDINAAPATTKAVADYQG